MQGSFFVSEIQKALAPAFSIAALVEEFPEFSRLPAFVGPLVRPNSTFRDICIENETLVLFENVCIDILRSSGMTNEIIDFQLLPVGVIAAVYPRAGNEGAIGLDTTMLPSELADVFKVLADGGFVMSGPLSLVQGGFNMIGKVAVLVPATTSTPRPSDCGCHAGSNVSLDECAQSAELETAKLRRLSGLVPRGMRWWGLVSLIFDFAALISSSGIDKQVTVLKRLVLVRLIQKPN